MNRLRILAPGLAALVMACGLLHGDDPKPPAQKGQLPARWSKLGLSDEQKTKVRAIRGDYAGRIEALRQLRTSIAAAACRGSKLA